jgi:hypothetical protein
MEKKDGLPASYPSLGVVELDPGFQGNPLQPNSLAVDW